MKVLLAISKGFSYWPYVSVKLEDLFSENKPGHLSVIGAQGEQLRTFSEELGVPCQAFDGNFELRSDAARAVAHAELVIAFWDGDSLSNVIFEARIQKRPIKIFPVEITKIVNRDNGDAFDYYIGRGTPWGNPYHVGKGPGRYSRDEAIELYRKHFEANILTDPRKRKALLGLRGYRLACHCKPLACHGDVIIEFLNFLDPDAVEAELQRPTQQVLALG